MKTMEFSSWDALEMGRTVRTPCPVQSSLVKTTQIQRNTRLQCSSKKSATFPFEFNLEEVRLG